MLSQETINEYEQYSPLGRFRRFLVKSKIDVPPEDTDIIFKWFENENFKK